MNMTQQVRFNVIFGKRDKIRYGELEKNFAEVDSQLRAQLAKELMLVGMKNSNLFEEYKKMSQGSTSETVKKPENESKTNEQDGVENTTELNPSKKTQEKPKYKKTGNLV